MTNIEAIRSLNTISDGTVATVTGLTRYDDIDSLRTAWAEQIDGMPEGSFSGCGGWQQVLDVLAAAPAVDEIGADHLTIGGVRIPAELHVSATGHSVQALLTMDGQRYRLIISRAHGDMLDAAKRAVYSGAPVGVDGEMLGALIAEARPMVRRTAPAERSADPAKQRHGDVPEKLFIGSGFEGRGWRILFDGDAGKTRVIFDRRPGRAVLDAVKAAGFCWNAGMRSWNKGLTFRAYRAAQALHVTLGKLMAA